MNRCIEMECMYHESCIRDHVLLEFLKHLLGHNFLGFNFTPVLLCPLKQRAKNLISQGCRLDIKISVKSLKSVMNLEWTLEHLRFGNEILRVLIDFF